MRHVALPAPPLLAERQHGTHVFRRHVDRGQDHGLLDPLDIGPEFAQPRMQVLVSPFDLTDVMDDAFALGDEGCDDQRHAGSNVRACQVLPAEL